MESVPTKKLGTAKQLRDGDIRMIRNAYGCGKKYQNIDCFTFASIHIFIFDRHGIYNPSTTSMQEQAW